MRRPALLTTLVAVVAACIPAVAVAAPRTGGRGGETVFVGTHGSGPGQGIFAAHFDQTTGKLTSLGLAAEIARPTWQVVSPDRRVLYSVSETGNDGKSEASVAAFAIDPVSARLTPLGQVGSGGGGATYASLDPRSATLFVANYGTGSITALPVNPDGSLGPVASRQQDAGSGPSPRQKSPHAHAVVIDPSGRFLLTADLGADRIFVSRFDPVTRQISPAPEPFLVAEAGSGPRHLVFSPDGQTLYGDSELNGTVTAYHWDGMTGRLAPLQTLSAFSPGYTGARSAAELGLSPNGRFLYVSTRNADEIVVYAVQPATGGLREVQRVSSGGKTPWSFSSSPDGRWLLVADEGANAVVVFKADRRTGKLTATDQALQIPQPVSIVFGAG